MQRVHILRSRTLCKLPLQVIHESTKKRVFGSSHVRVPVSSKAKGGKCEKQYEYS